VYQGGTRSNVRFGSKTVIQTDQPNVLFAQGADTPGAPQFPP
jgi:hypothetical protein